MYEWLDASILHSDGRPDAEVESFDEHLGPTNFGKARIEPIGKADAPIVAGLGPLSDVVVGVA
jgi:hypothetical protein